ncbi:MAG: NAD-dependent epimerase/dehydratase family protein [Opitutaceae bacterium]|nr:NAD-dependent epimerase/dehydratase family protein [Opitutaceae bacterium]
MDMLAGKRLVIFGCGYVGAAVAERAMAAGARVIALTRNAEKASALRAAGIETVVAELADDRWHGLIEGTPDFVLNCVSSGGGGAEAYRRSYVDGLRSILTWARAHGPAGTLLYTSSTSVYAQRDGMIVDETMPTVASSDRAAVLIEAERLVRECGAAARRWWILRLAGIYGPGRFHLLEQVRTGEVAGVGTHHLNLIHRDDIVAAVLAALTAPASEGNEALNLADDGRALKSEVVGWLAAQLAVPMPRFSGAPAGGRRAVTPDRVIANARAKAVLGWRPVFPTFREGCASLLSP